MNDLEVLQPDHQVEIDGRTLTVREYRFFEGAQLRAAHRGFFAALYALFASDQGAPTFDDISELLGAHEDDVVAMVALASDSDPAWIRGLGDADGDALMLTWWVANNGFFIRRVLRRATVARLDKASSSAGAGSSTTSSPADTSAAPPTSPGSPPDR